MIEKNGTEAFGAGMVERDHIIAWIDGDGDIQLEVDNYKFLYDLEKFDVEDWENSKIFLCGPAKREIWQLVFSVARAMVRHGVVRVFDQGKLLETVRFNGAVYEFALAQAEVGYADER